MNWDKWSGFCGEGTYIILNRSSLYSLGLDHKDDLTTVRPHAPHNPSQLWRVYKWPKGDVYIIVNLHHKAIVTSRDYVLGYTTVEEGALHEKLTDLPYRYSVDALWAIDKSMCSLEPGQMVVFRSIKNPGFVLSQDSTGEFVTLWQEEQSTADGEGEEQKWLMQKQDVDGAYELVSD
ncbi:MAG: hypothetical protein Q9221_004728 [Calogaya cf. arnoldii]